MKSPNWKSKYQRRRKRESTYIGLGLCIIPDPSYRRTGPVSFGGGGEGWGPLPEYFFPSLARKSSGFARIPILAFLPENGHLKISRGVQPPSPPPLMPKTPPLRLQSDPPSQPCAEGKWESGMNKMQRCHVMGNRGTPDKQKYGVKRDQRQVGRGNGLSWAPHLRSVVIT